MPTDRDDQLIAYVHRHGVCTIDQLGRASVDGRPSFSGRTPLFRRVRALRSMGLLESRPTWHRGPHALTTTAVAARLCRGLGIDLAPLRKVDDVTLREALELVDVGQRMLASNPGSRWLTRRELAAAEGDSRTPIGGALVQPDGTRRDVYLDLYDRPTQEYERLLTALAAGRRPVLWLAAHPDGRARLSELVDASGMTPGVAVQPWTPWSAPPSNLAIVAYVLRHGAVAMAQLAKAAPEGVRFAADTEGIARRLAPLQRDGLLARARSWWRGPHVVVATDKGARHCRAVGVHLSAPRALDFNTLRHDLEVVDLSEVLLATNPGSRWLTERELRRDAMADAQRQGFDPLAAHLRTPDGALVHADGQRILVELDLTDKRTERYEAILTTYAGMRRVAAVWWYVAPPSSRQRLVALVQRSGMHDLVHVQPWTPVLQAPAEALAL